MIRSKLQIKNIEVSAECVDIPTLPRLPLMGDLFLETRVKFKIFIDEVCNRIDKNIYTQFSTPDLVKKIESIFDIWCDVATRVIFQSSYETVKVGVNNTLHKVYVKALQQLEQNSDIDTLQSAFRILFAFRYQKEDIDINNIDIGIMYMLATIFIECGWSTKFDPISEGFNIKIGSPAWCEYLHSKITNSVYVRVDSKTKKQKAEDLLNYKASNGTTYIIPKYYGRGFIQTTGFKNYETAQNDYIKQYYSDRYSNINLTEDPDSMIQTAEISAIASIFNVFFGVWTGSPYMINKFLNFTKTKRIFKSTEARRIVNANGSAPYQMGKTTSTINQAIKKMMTDFSKAITVYLVTSDNEKIFAVGGGLFSESNFI